MSLVLQIEFLTGVYRAAEGPDSDVPDWPPQPDRVFSALTSAWGVRGEVPCEREALEWLECQPAPAIWASDYTARTAPDVFVPPNDARASRAETSRAEKVYLRVLPEHRARQPRRFPVARPDDPMVEMVWAKGADGGVLDSLNALANHVGYLGHSASLVRCRFLVGREGRSERTPSQARRGVYPGRLRELREAHRARPVRPVIRSGASIPSASKTESAPSTEWLVLEAVEGDIPDIRAAALVCRLCRHALMAGYRRVGWGDDIPEVVSGHSRDGLPTRLPHLAIVPMAFVGSSHADGRVFGFALVPPPNKPLEQIDGFREAFEKVATYHPGQQRRVLSLKGTPLRKPLSLAPAPTQGRARQSLVADPYLGKSSRWASVTPIVLERHLKRNDDAELRELVALACENAGLPRPSPDRIRVGKHSTINGAPPATPLSGEPPWMRWKVPNSLASRRLVHAIIDFERDLRGPVLLGAGRFTGLGLCRGVGH